MVLELFLHGVRELVARAILLMIEHMTEKTRLTRPMIPQALCESQGVSERRGRMCEMCVIGATLTLVNPTAATAIPNMIPETDRRLLCAEPSGGRRRSSFSQAETICWSACSCCRPMIGRGLGLSTCQGADTAALECPLLALSGHNCRVRECPLFSVKRTLLTGYGAP
jgi:hypothetical protein